MALLAIVQEEGTESNPCLPGLIGHAFPPPPAYLNSVQLRCSQPITQTYSKVGSLCCSANRLDVEGDGLFTANLKIHQEELLGMDFPLNGL